MPPARVTVLVADDHRLMREGTAALLETEPRISVVGLARDGREVIEQAIALRPDVILLDLNMPVVGGIQACAVLRTRLPETQVLILTVSEQDEDLYAAVRVGAAGYLLKDMPPADLVEAVLELRDGRPRIAPRMARLILDDLGSTGQEESRDRSTLELSDRERQVLALLARGLTNREIGGQLQIGDATVKTHVRRVLDKLHLRNRTEAAAFAARQLPGSGPSVRRDTEL